MAMHAVGGPTHGSPIWSGRPVVTRLGLTQAVQFVSGPPPRHVAWSDENELLCTCDLYIYVWLIIILVKKMNNW